MHPLLAKRIETPSWLVTLTIASLLAFVGGISCFLFLHLFANWVPIESLVVVLFFLVYTPCVFGLSIPCVMLARRFLARRGVRAGFRQFIIIFAVGSLVTTLILAIIFPRDTPPYFVGGYLLKGLFRL